MAKFMNDSPSPISRSRLFFKSDRIEVHRVLGLSDRVALSAQQRPRAVFICQLYADHRLGSIVRKKFEFDICVLLPNFSIVDHLASQRLATTGHKSYGDGCSGIP